MREYLKRLKEHPGLPFVLIMCVASFAAALSNKTLDEKSAIIVGSFFSAVFLLVILISNIKK